MGTGLGQRKGGEEAGLAEGHRASGCAGLQCPVAPCPSPLASRSFWGDGASGATRGRLGQAPQLWMKQWPSGLPRCPDEFPSPWACSPACPGQGGCLPNIFSPEFTRGGWLGELGAPTRLLARQTSARKGPGAPPRRPQPLCPSLARLLEPLGLVWWEGGLAGAPAKGSGQEVPGS